MLEILLLLLLHCVVVCSVVKWRPCQNGLTIFLTTVMAVMGVPPFWRAYKIIWQIFCPWQRITFVLCFLNCITLGKTVLCIFDWRTIYLLSAVNA